MRYQLLDPGDGLSPPATLRSRIGFRIGVLLGTVGQHIPYVRDVLWRWSVRRWLGGPR